MPWFFLGLTLFSLYPFSFYPFSSLTATENNYDTPSTEYERKLVVRTQKVLKNDTTLEALLADRAWTKNIHGLYLGTQESLRATLLADKFMVIDYDPQLIDKTEIPCLSQLLVYRHTEALETSLIYCDDLFTEVFTVIIDHWDRPEMRQQVYSAFAKLDYKILFEAHLLQGGYLAVIRRPDAYFSD